MRVCPPTARARTGRPGADDGRYFRWHDSGDLQSVTHLSMLVAVAESVPGVEFWLPTREVTIVREYLRQGGTLPANFTVRLSLPRVGIGPAPIHRKLACHPRVTLSGVHDTSIGQAPPDSFAECPAYQNAGACGDCRTCWMADTEISYPLH
jgi:hypothetical protein